jgi:Ca2+/H+ antiporter
MTKLPVPLAFVIVVTAQSLLLNTPSKKEVIPIVGEAHAIAAAAARMVRAVEELARRRFMSDSLSCFMCVFAE